MEELINKNAILCNECVLKFELCSKNYDKEFFMISKRLLYSSTYLDCRFMAVFVCCGGQCSKHI